MVKTVLPVALAALIWAPFVGPEAWAVLLNALAPGGEVRPAPTPAPIPASPIEPLLPVLGVAMLLVVVLGGVSWFLRTGPAPILLPTGYPARRRVPVDVVEPVGPEEDSDEFVARVGGTPRASWGAVLVAAGVVVLGLLAVAGTGHRPATAGEELLAAGVAMHPGSVLAPLSGPDMVAATQLAALDVLLPARGGVVDDVRTAVLLVGLLGCLLLWPLVRRLAVSPAGAALAVALCGLPVLATELSGSIDAGALAALWLTVGAVLAGWSRTGSVVAVGAVAHATDVVQRWLTSQLPGCRPDSAAVEQGVLVVRYTVSPPSGPSAG